MTRRSPARVVPALRSFLTSGEPPESASRTRSTTRFVSTLEALAVDPDSRDGTRFNDLNDDGVDVASATACLEVDASVPMQKRARERSGTTRG